METLKFSKLPSNIQLLVKKYKKSYSSILHSAEENEEERKIAKKTLESAGYKIYLADYSGFLLIRKTEEKEFKKIEFDTVPSKEKKKFSIFSFLKK